MKNDFFTFFTVTQVGQFSSARQKNKQIYFFPLSTITIITNNNASIYFHSEQSENARRGEKN